METETQLENEAVKQLVSNGFKLTKITNEEELIQNFKKNLEEFNKIKLSNHEFIRVMQALDKGKTPYVASKILRDKVFLKRDDNTTTYLTLINKDEWCKNNFQVAQQITIKGKYENRYDITLLVNGLPLLQLELKRKGIELKKAFNQTIRYQRHSFQGLFSFIQLFVISNGINTRYYSNNKELKFENVFIWTDKENKPINKISEFIDDFLEPCKLMKIISRYILLNNKEELLFVLRPYQIYAVEGILNQVTHKKNGYVWHSTGSGKTLTSFKTSEILSQSKQVIFVLDRNDIFDQSVKEFKFFVKSELEETENTKHLYKQLKNRENFIITTIQKLDRVMKKYEKDEKDENLFLNEAVIIFDECHRSQFGSTHRMIKEKFKNSITIGFTGTPIFAKNAYKGLTTKSLFGECLHKYILPDAIADKNVLPFQIEYWGKAANTADEDEKVSGIDLKSFYHSEKRLSEIVEWITQNHDKKTRNRAFNAILAVDSQKTLKTYLELFEEANHNLNITTIFSYDANEDIDSSVEHSQDTLDRYIKDYNKRFKTNFSYDHFHAYSADISRRIKNHQKLPKSERIDILIVVRMFLTGFDSKTLNILYDDQSTEYHTLLQKISRTNRKFDETKPFGQIISFRPETKPKFDEAIALYSDNNPNEMIIIGSYEEHKDVLNTKINEFKKIVPNYEDIDLMKGEKEKATFIKSFRDIIKSLDSLKYFNDFSFDDIAINKDEIIGYETKYKDIYISEIKEQSDKVSILNDIDFAMELLQKDTIDFDYIMDLLSKVNHSSDDKEKEINKILTTIKRDINLSSKYNLIEKFIKTMEENSSSEKLSQDFTKFSMEEYRKEVFEFSDKNDIFVLKMTLLIEKFRHHGKEFNGKEIESIFNPEKVKIGILTRKKYKDMVNNKIKYFIDKYDFL